MTEQSDWLNTCLERRKRKHFGDHDQGFQAEVLKKFPDARHEDGFLYWEHVAGLRTKTSFVCRSPIVDYSSIGASPEKLLELYDMLCEWGYVSGGGPSSPPDESMPSWDENFDLTVVKWFKKLKEEQ